MEITILFTSKQHPIYPHLLNWVNKNLKNHSVILTNKIVDVNNGDILFLIACNEIVEKEIRNNFQKTLCVHESDLPKGKGWSPCVHYVLQGENKIPMTLFEASDKVDSGDIWKKTHFILEGHELSDEINNLMALKTIELIDFAIKNFNDINPMPQEKFGESYFPRRSPDDSLIDVDKTIAEQFNLMRVADENRYPCFFFINGFRYKLTLKKY